MSENRITGFQRQNDELSNRINNISITIAGLRPDIDDLKSDYEDDTTTDDPGQCPCGGPTSGNETENLRGFNTYFPFPGRCPSGNEATLSTILTGLDQWVGK